MMPRELRTLADFVDLPEDELSRCLQAFRLAVLSVKASRLAVQGKGMPPESVPFDTFIWKPKEVDGLDSVIPLPTTPIDELPLRHGARFKLKEINVFCLEDFSEVTENEFRCIPDVGRLTIEKVRSMLKEIGLTFKRDPDPMRQLREDNRLARQQVLDARLKSITDESRISALGLSPGTFAQAHRRGHLTVGAIRALRLRELGIKYGKQHLREILGVLEQAGLSLHHPPTKLDLWRDGLLKKGDLDFPRDPQADIGEAAPWIGTSLVRKFRDRGIVTLKALADVFRQPSQPELVGIGPKTRDKLIAFLHQAAHLESTNVTAPVALSSLRRVSR